MIKCLGNGREGPSIWHPGTTTRGPDPARLSILMLYSVLLNLPVNFHFPSSQASPQALTRAKGVLPGLGCPLFALHSSWLAKSLIITETKRAGEPESPPSHPPKLRGQIVCQPVVPYHSGHLSSWLNVAKCHPSFVSLGDVLFPLLARLG